MRWFRGAGAAPAQPPGKPGTARRATRRSIGWTEFTRTLARYEEPCVLDLGPVSSVNISFLIGFGGRVFNEDVLRASRDTRYLAPQQEGLPSLDSDKFFSENMEHTNLSLDAVLLWDVADYLDEELVKPMVERIHRAMKPGGTLLAFFRTKDAGPESPYNRYHIVDPEVLELEPKAEFPLRRVFNNRHIENLFKDFSSLKFFLARDNVREVLVTR